MRFYSTAEVAGKVGVHKATLLRWLYAKAIPEPKRYRNAGQDVRLWTQRDLDKVRRYKDANYCKGRGRKKAKRKAATAEAQTSTAA